MDVGYRVVLVLKCHTTVNSGTGLIFMQVVNLASAWTQTPLPWRLWALIPGEIGQKPVQRRDDVEWHRSTREKRWEEEVKVRLNERDG